MDESFSAKIIYWLPRIMAIIIVAFFIAFVFLSHGFSAESLVESSVWVVLLLATILAWKWEGWGGLIFIVLGLGYIGLASQRATITALLVVSLPIIITGLLFIISKYRR
jgi:hypothetical protein